MPESHLVTGLLDRWEAGDKDALDELVPAIYEELRRLARLQLMNERRGHTLHPTALVHEAFLRFGNYDRITWQNRAHFLAVASKIMRRVLVDHARKRRAAKRGGGMPPVTLIESRSPNESVDVDVVALDQVLTKLDELDARQCQIVELRFFGGLEHKEIAELLDISVATVNRDWRVAKLWLRRALSEPHRSGG